MSCSFGPPWRVLRTSATSCKQLMSHKFYADKKKTSSRCKLYSVLLKADTTAALLTIIVVTFFHSSLVQEASGVNFTVTRSITTFQSTTDRIYDSGPIIL